VDQLLRGAAATPEEKIELKSEAKPEPRRTIPDPQPPRNLPTNDPYREPPK
ncbi:MAG: hypothetical protein JWO00_153, partial [Candidatus Parcubacteria bacterium]|nr:hypothetical protein [Candidatus Parcubacteria bacterium]